MTSLKKQSGVTLVELVILIVVMAIIIPPLASGFSTSGKMMGVKKNLQLAVFEMEACAEHILGVRRKQGYGAINEGDSTICDIAVPSTSEFSAVPLTRIVTITEVFFGSNTECPILGPSDGCKKVYVSVKKGTQVVSSVEFMLVYY